MTENSLQRRLSALRPKLISLLYVDPQRTKIHNTKAGHRNPLDVYVQCALTLARSCELQEMDFELVTNHREIVAARLTSLGAASQIRLVECSFALDVPADIAFYGAHFKLELFRMFGTGEFGPLVGFIDLDAVVLRPITVAAEEQGGFLAYDIAGHIRQEFGDDRVLHDLALVGGPPARTAYWYGGELLIASADRFRRLSEVSVALWPAYMRHYKTLHHVSDEVITTAALQSLKDEIPIYDAGRDVVARWWTARTCFAQEPFAAASQKCVLHLPSDKDFLSDVMGAFSSSDELLSRYRRHAAPRLWTRRALNVPLNLAEKRHRYVGRLS